ncbi:MAG: glycosyltransferase [Planctomycetota bacterium]|jgi:glycosyltransferase involved in cell wall biosynthesis
MKRSEAEETVFDGLLCFGGVDWWYHNRAHSDVQIMLQISKRLPVLFINSLATQPARRIWRKLRSMLKGLRKVSSNMWVFTPIMLPPTKIHWLRRINARLISSQILLVLRFLGIRHWFNWVTVPTASDVLRVLPTRPTIFNRSDRHSRFPEADEQFIKSCEQDLLNDSQAVLYVNKKLMKEDAGPDDRKYYLGHGVDFDRFLEAANGKRVVHPELARLKRPIVGFFGAIDDYTVDLELLKFAAESLPDMSFVLVGLSTLDISDVTSLPNVHYLGFKPYSEIPRLGAGFDVGIMPWLQNEWILYCNPVKLKEYLALGLPIVTTPIPQEDEYGDLMTVARTPQEFIEAIRVSATADDRQLRQRRQEAVERDSWRNKANEVLELANTMARRHAVSPGGIK